MNKWEKFLALSFGERILFLQLLFLLPVTDLALKMLGLHKLRNILAKSPSRKRNTKSIPDTIEEARRLAYIVSAAARHSIHHATCLRQSLLLWWLLHRRGIVSELRIGVQKDAGKLLAHAWVRVNGEVISDEIDSESQFSAFDQLPF